MVLLAIRGSRGIVPKLAEALNCSHASVYRYIADNDILLTTAAALKVIREELKIEDSEILEGIENETAA